MERVGEEEEAEEEDGEDDGEDVAGPPRLLTRGRTL
jgi:hypothetical protein